jgi:hypothetical protein
MTPVMYFVWIRGLRGPEPQKWSQLEKQRGRDYLKGWVIPPDQHRLTLDQLAALYPRPDDE